MRRNFQRRIGKTGALSVKDAGPQVRHLDGRLQSEGGLPSWMPDDHRLEVFRSRAANRENSFWMHMESSRPWM